MNFTSLKPVTPAGWPQGDVFNIKERGMFRELIFCGRKCESVADRNLGQVWGNPSPFVHFLSSTFGSSLAEPSSRGFELGDFLPEPGLPAGYSEFLIRSEKPDKPGTDMGGICSTAEQEGRAASILGLLQPDFPFFIVQDDEQSHQRSWRQESLVLIPKYKCSWLRSRWTLK